MLIKHFSRKLATLLLICLAAASAASAQTAEARGKVTMRGADGAETPVQGAIVTLFRTDIKGKYETKTNKKGEYVRVGLPLGGTFTITVSAPGATPTFRENVRFNAPQEANFTLQPGDGSTLNLEQLTALKASGGNANTTAPTASTASTEGAATPAPTATAANPQPPAKETAEQKKAREAYEKELAAVEAKNTRARDLNAKLPDILKQANSLYDKKEYDQAIAKYDEGLALDPEQGVFHQNKAIALRLRAIDKYNKAVTNTDKAARSTGVTAARADMKAAVDASEKAVEMYKTQAAAKAGDAASQQNITSALDTRKESYVMALRVGVSDVSDKAIPAIQEYVNAETDAAKKSRAEASLADALFQSGQVDQAVEAYNRVLASNPNNLDALYGLGIAYSSTSKNAEAIDALKKFISKATGQEYATKKQEAQQLLAATEEALKTDADQRNKPAPRSTGGRRRGN